MRPQPQTDSFQQEKQKMMTFRIVGEYVSAEPFRPFRLKMASGQTFDIRHPEMILVGKSSVRVYSKPKPDSTDEYWQDVSLMLMEAIEPIDASSTTSATSPTSN
jgi:hypothetical protein